jgi:hypothetical protein
MNVLGLFGSGEFSIFSFQAELKIGIAGCGVTQIFTPHPEII